VILPAMTVEQLINLYTKLFEGVEMFKRKCGEGDVWGEYNLDWERGIDDGLSFGADPKKYDGSYHNFKNLYEAASRRIACMLSIVYANQWIIESEFTTRKVQNALFDNFARSIRRLYRGDTYVHGEHDYISIVKKSIQRCINNVSHCNDATFDFLNNYPIPDNCNYQEFIDEIDGGDAQRKLDIDFLLTETLSSYSNADDGDDTMTAYKLFNKVASLINNSDLTHKFKLPPVPTLEIIYRVHKILYPDCELTNELFAQHVVSLYSANEDARSGCAIYAEPLRFENGERITARPLDKYSFIIADCYQCGELSIKQVYDVVKSPQLLSYLVSAEVSGKAFYRNTEIRENKNCIFAKRLSELLSQSGFILEATKIEHMLNNISLKDYYAGDLNLQINAQESADIVSQSEILRNEIQKLISEIYMTPSVSFIVENAEDSEFCTV
jgi:hypothetical protein